MKTKISSILAALVIGIAVVGCNNTSQRDTSSETETTQQSDTTYMESQDNNGQPTSDQDGGTVTETEGAPESGYGTSNGSELESADEGNTEKD